MKFLRFLHDNQIHTGILAGAMVIPAAEINAKRGTRIPDDLLVIIQQDLAHEFEGAAELAGIPLQEVRPQLPYDVPPKIWCIGLNYRSHAEDIDAVQPEEPGSFMKPASCMFPPGGDIVLPPTDISDDVDAEGELGVIIGKTCRF